MGDAGGLSEKEKADLRWRLAKARREEMLVEQLKGQLVPVRWVEEEFGKRAEVLAKALWMLSRRIAHKVAMKSKKTMNEVVGIIDREVRGMMEVYSRPLEKDGAGRA